MTPWEDYLDWQLEDIAADLGFSLPVNLWSEAGFWSDAVTLPATAVATYYLWPTKT